MDKGAKRTLEHACMASLTCLSILFPPPRGGRARHICRLGRHEDRRRSMPCSSRRGDRTAPAGFASMHELEVLSSNYPLESHRHHPD